MIITRIKDIQDSKDLVGKFCTEFNFEGQEYELEIVSSKTPILDNSRGVDRYFSTISIWNNNDTMVFFNLFNRTLSFSDIIDQNDTIINNAAKYIKKQDVDISEEKQGVEASAS